MKTLLIILLLIPIAVYSQNEPAKPDRKFVDRIPLDTSRRPTVSRPLGLFQTIHLDTGMTLHNKRKYDSGISFDVSDSIKITDRVIMYFPDSTIKIEGDTIKLFRLLYKEYLKCKNW